MTEEKDTFSNQDILKDELSEAERLGAQITGSLKGKLIRWAIRWTLGFGLIALAVHFKPHWQWLWYLGAGIAAFSLISMLLLRQVVKKRLEQLNARVEEARQVAEETDSAD